MTSYELSKKLSQLMDTLSDQSPLIALLSEMSSVFGQLPESCLNF